MAEGGGGHVFRSGRVHTGVRGGTECGAKYVGGTVVRLFLLWAVRDAPFAPRAAADSMEEMGRHSGSDTKGMGE